jgi:glycosyltransferase involved in cell wall biosynthesis
MREEDYNVQEFGLAKALLKQGIQTDIYCAGEQNEVKIIDYKTEGDVKARIFRLPYRSFLNLHAIFPGLSGILKHESYDLLHTLSYEQITSYVISWFGTQHRIPVVVHEGLYERDFGRFINFTIKSFHLTLGKYMRSHVSGCIAKTQMAKDYLRKKGFQDIEIIPIGLDTEKFKNISEINWKERLGIKNDTHILLYIGIIESRRHVDFLIRIVAELTKKQQSVCLVIAGSGPDENLCKNLAQELGIQDSVIFLGKIPQSEVPSLYKEAELFLLPSDYEIVGMVILESLYFGVPVLSSRTAGGLDIIGDKKCGKLFEGFHVEQWAEFIYSYLNTPEKYGFKDYLATHPFDRSWEQLGATYADFYQKVIERYRKRS